MLIAILAYLGEWRKRGRKASSVQDIGMQGDDLDEEPGQFVEDDDDESSSSQPAKPTVVPKTHAEALERLGLERIFMLRVERAKNRSVAVEKDAKGLNLPLEIFTATDGIDDTTWRSRIIPSMFKNATCTHIIGAIFNTHERVWRVI